LKDKTPDLEREVGEIAMWASFFAIAVAAAICLSAVNLASEINKIQQAKHAAAVEYRAPTGAPPLGRSTDAGGSTIRKTVAHPGA
jgi:hypothetical protein